MTASTGQAPKTGAMIAERLRHQIARGELEIGQRLPTEDELTVEFGIARTTLREALRILESQGLLEIRRGRTGGPVVTMPRIDALAEGLAVTLQLRGTTAGDLDAARQLIEPALAAQLARRHTADDLAMLSAAVDRAAAAAARADKKAFGVAAADVHESLIECAGNSTLATLSRLLHAMVAQYYERSAAASTPDKMQRAVRSYRKLVRLVEHGDADAAEEHWRKQMTFTIEGWRNNRRIQLFDG
jgi:GntR family transcriptional regulator, transcriptional repressor for pyruvate dehydrogenase complex